jgi:hypothetical protein
MWEELCKRSRIAKSYRNSLCQYDDSDAHRRIVGPKLEEAEKRLARAQKDAHVEAVRAGVELGVGLVKRGTTVYTVSAGGGVQCLCVADEDTLWGVAVRSLEHMRRRRFG